MSKKNVNQSQNATATAAAETKAVRTLDTIKSLLKDLNNVTLTDVKPGGVGVKIEKTRLCAVYLTKGNGYRIKTNKLDFTDTIHSEYSVTLDVKLTSDGRDINITGADLDDEMLKSIINDLEKLVATTAEKKASEKKAREVEKAKKASEKKAAKKAEKKASEKPEKKAPEKKAV